MHCPSEDTPDESACQPDKWVSKPKRTRKGTPKSRSGCRTCRIRRVKCDEARPSCAKCSSTGRQCDGYQLSVIQHGKPPQVSMPPNTDPLNYVAMSVMLQSDITVFNPWNPFLDHPGTEQEHRYLAFFRNQTAPLISGYFDADFWNSILPRVGESEPTIRHAMMAVAAIHEQVEINSSALFDFGVEDSEATNRRHFALSQYNKAIQHLNQRLLVGPEQEEVTLLCCVLFICLELLRRNIDAAVSHLTGGLGILVAWRDKAGHSVYEQTLDSPSIPDPIAIVLTNIFSRLTCQSFIIGRRSAELCPPLAGPDASVNIRDSFDSLLDARAMMDNLIRIFLRFFRSTVEVRYGAPSPRKEMLEMKRLEHVDTLAKWSIACRALLARTDRTMRGQERRATAEILALSIALKIFLVTCLSFVETAFDDLLEEFSDIVTLATSVIHDDCPVTPTSPQAKESAKVPFNFSFEMGFIFLLYFVAVKCRDPTTRRNALDLLLTTTPRREGLWDADLSYAVARRVMEVEEQGSDGADVASRALPAESHRIHHTIIHPRRKTDTTQLENPNWGSGPKSSKSGWNPPLNQCDPNTTEKTGSPRIQDVTLCMSYWKYRHDVVLW